MSDILSCIAELKRYNGISGGGFFEDEQEEFRALQNITMPYSLSDEFYKKQDGVLREILTKKKITDVDTLTPIRDRICLYKGDITLLKADAIVNACNSKLLGCFVPGHKCIDNAIHSFAGLQVRRDLIAVMEKQGHDEENGKCKVTKGYNLPSKYIFHTVGPIYTGRKKDDEDLKNCYFSCLKTADDMKLKNVVFCSLSTGIFSFPIERAADIAVKAVTEYLKENKGIERVVFDVFSDGDYAVYKKILSER